MKVLYDRVVIIPDKIEEKTKSGIILAPMTQEKPSTGVVYTTGPGIDKIIITCKKGDRVMFGKNSGQEIVIDGETYLILHEREILVILD